MRRHLLAIAFAVIGVGAAYGLTAGMLWLETSFPSHGSVIRALGPWVIAFCVCLAGILPILLLYGIIKSPLRPKE